MAIDLTTFSTNGLDIYFQSRRTLLNAHLASHLVDFINATETSLDCAIYDLRYPDILDALARVAQSGKQLRLVFDAGQQRSGNASADPKPSGTAQALHDAGLLDIATPVHPGGGHLMHNKFLVRDQRFVWTGSANFTVGGLELQDNHCMAIDSPDLAAVYSVAFEELLQIKHLHAGAGAAQTPAAVTLGNVKVTPFFTPMNGEDIEQVVVASLANAQRVRVMAFLISDPGILAALAPFGNNANTDIRGIYDPGGMHDAMRSTKIDQGLFWFMHDDRFVAAPSHPFNPSREQDFMHNKVMVIDDHLVIMGSYNFSENAEANDENLLLIDSPAVAAAYMAYFDAMYDNYHTSASTRAA